VYFAFKHGLLGVVAIDTAVVSALAALLVLERIPLRWRARLFCLVCYALGMGLLLRVGSVSQIYLFGFSVMSVLLLGLRVGLGAVAVSSVSLL
jgi:hypothetical protein